MAYDEALKQFRFGLSAGYGKLTAEQKINALRELLPMVDTGISHCAVSRRYRATLDRYASELERLLRRVEEVRKCYSDPPVVE